MRLYKQDETNFNTNGVAILQPLSAKESLKLNKMSTLKLIMPYNNLIKTNMIIKTEELNYYKITRISKTDKRGLVKMEIDCERMFENDMIEQYVESYIHSDKSINYLLDKILVNTKYKVGINDDFGLLTYSITQTNKLKIIQDLLSITGAELKIDEFEISFKKQVGTLTGARVEKGKNILGISKDEDVSNLVTKLHYSNKEGAFGGTIESSNVSIYGVKEMYKEFEGETSAETKTNAQNWLSQNDKPFINYKIDLIDLSRTLEYEKFKDFEKIEVGDFGIIKHDILDVDIQGRVFEIERDLLNKKNSKVVYGNYTKDYFKGNVDLEKTKSTVDYAFIERKLNTAVLRGIKVIDDNTGKVSFEITDSGECIVNIGENAQVVDILDRLTTAEGTIKDNASEILDNSTAINGNSQQITINKQGITSLNSSISTLDGKIDANETAITQNSSEIALRATQASVDTIEGLVNVNTASITTNASNINLKVSKNSVISEINQSAEAVTIAANKINLTGYVTISDLSQSGATTINGDNITSGLITGVGINAEHTVTIKENLVIGSLGGYRMSFSQQSDETYIRRDGNVIAKTLSNGMYLVNMAVKSGQSIGVLSATSSTRFIPVITLYDNRIEFGESGRRVISNFYDKIDMNYNDIVGVSTLEHKGSLLGFYGTSPTGKRSVSEATSSTQVYNKLNELIRALDAYGLV